MELSFIHQALSRADKTNSETLSSGENTFIFLDNNLFVVRSADPSAIPFFRISGLKAEEEEIDVYENNAQLYFDLALAPFLVESGYFSDEDISKLKSFALENNYLL